MEFEWDEEKRKTLLADRQVDLLRAARIFERPVVERLDSRADYGETRYVAIGTVDEECYVVVYTLRGAIMRLITAWNGGRRAKARYQARYAGRDQTDG